MRGRIKEDDSSVPQPDGPFAYLWKLSRGRPARSDRPHAARRRRGPARARRRCAGQGPADYFKFGGTRHSPDHRLEAWSADLRGSEYFTIRVRDWQTGEDLPDVIEQTSGSVVWGRDSTFFFYVRLDDNHRPLHVYRHRLGTPQSDGRAGLRGEGQRLVHAHRGKRQRAASASSPAGNQETSERWLIDLADARRRAAPGRAARDRRALQRRRSRR